MQITSLEQLKAMKKSEIIELSPFEDGTPLVAEVQKPNMRVLLTSNKIPNTLNDVAMAMFNGKTGDIATKASTDIKTLKDMVAMMEVLAEACLVMPKYSDIKKAGIHLTEQQLMEILTYSQGGVKALENFRTK